jgi:hypothetical protein
MAGSSQTLAIGIAVVSILILIRYAWAVIQTPLTPLRSGLEEPFAVAPRRAADCKCLAGYVPSKSIKSAAKLYEITDFKDPLTKENYLVTINFSTKEKLVITLLPTDACYGRKTEVATLPREYTTIQAFLPIFNQVSDNRATLATCDQINELLASNGESGDHYFCQSLSDPAKRRDCY